MTTRAVFGLQIGNVNSSIPVWGQGIKVLYNHTALSSATGASVRKLRSLLRAPADQDANFEQLFRNKMQPPCECETLGQFLYV